MTSTYCSIFLGLLFIASAFLKLSDIENFKEYLDQYPWLKSATHGRAFAMVCYQFALGLALLFLWQRVVLLAVALGTIVVLSGVTLIGLLKYDIQTCGCYGKYMRLTPQQSLKLNMGYMLIACIGLTALH